MPAKKATPISSTTKTASATPARLIEAARNLLATNPIIALRKRTPDLHAGAYNTLPAPDGAWAFRRGEGTVVAVNLTASRTAVAGVNGRVLLATDRSRDGAQVKERLELAPWEGVVLARSP